MARINGAERTVLMALAPEAPYLAAGTMGGAVGQPASTSTMQIYSINFQSDSPNAQFLVDTSTSDHFNRLCWSRPAAAEDPSFSLGLLAGGLSDGSVDVWNPLKMISSNRKIEDAMVARLEKHNGAVTGLDFSELEPHLLASGSSEGVVRIWDLKNPREAGVLPKNVGSTAQAKISCVTWNTSLKYILASGSTNGITVLWDLRNQKPFTSLVDSDKRKCSIMRWNPDISPELIVASDDDSSPSLRVWDMRNPSAPVQELTGHSKGIIAMSWCSSDSSFLLTCDKDNRTICWDTVSREIISELVTSFNSNFDIQWYRKNPVVLAASSFDKKIGLHNLEFSGTYGADDSALGASARPKAPAPKWLKCPTRAGASEVHVNNLVNETGDGKRKELPEQIDTSGDKIEIKCATDFVGVYYRTFNETPELLPKLYADGSTINWPNSDGEMKEISGAKALKNLFASKMEVCKDFVMSKIFVQTSQNGSLLAVVNGRFTNAEKRLSKFTQSFVLKKVRDTEFIISNDVMTPHGFHQHVCVIYDDEMTHHLGNTNEKPKRIASIMKKFREDGLLQRCSVERPSQVKDNEISAAHKKGYLSFIKDMPMTKQKQLDYSRFFVQRDISFSEGTQKAVLLSAGAVLKACKLVMTGKYDHAFAVVRPPGHHARANKAEGFCYLNNIAIGAQELLRNHDVEKILIFDFDVHHGDGTQSIFLKDKRVLFVSTHRGGENFFPNSRPNEKDAEEIGKDGAEGYNINICLPEGFEDDDLLVAVKYVLLPVARSFSPDIILVSAGYDAAEGDKIGGCKVTPPCFGTIIDELKRIPSKRGLVLALEGGYNLSSLANSASACLRSLLGDRDFLIARENYSPYKETWDSVIKSRSLLSPYWPVLLPEIPKELRDKHREATSMVVPGDVTSAGETNTRGSKRLAFKRAAQERDPDKSKASHPND